MAAKSRPDSGYTATSLRDDPRYLASSPAASLLVMKV